MKRAAIKQNRSDPNNDIVKLNECNKTASTSE